ncbi:peptidase S33 [Intrasporangium oryzae NRRL B-24470]|uniref:Peptidase S33 n=1 Tax=Intrasporangium oryzae NRRL B-24470 TaxID=1386089 RepID=W9G146_9MICO|nr:alpha/beta hydrolase [Intrasporangium oryzae]EWS99659.1 peptidase S33 [Intrasporangium oryzae NRRL B-24470]
MSPGPRSNPVFGIAAAAIGVAAGVAAGIAAERAGQHRAAIAALETPELLEIVPDEEHIVLTDDGVALHVEIDLPTSGDAARAAAGTTRGDRPESLPTVVLTHGYCLSLKCWVYQRRALRDAGYRVISWDQRGHGRSGRGEPSSYVIDRLGTDLAAVVNAHAPEGDLVLVGHSMGGMTVMAFGEQHPDLVRERVIGVAFVGTSPGGLNLANGGRMATFARSLLEHVGPSVLGPLSERPALFSRLRRVGRDLEYFLVEQNSFGSPVPRSVVRYTADILLGTPLDVINDYLETFDGFDKRPALAEFTSTLVLVFNGKQDLLTPPAHSELIVEAIPGAEHIVVNDAGHVIMLEHPELLNAHLIELADQAARARAEQIDVAKKPRVRRIVTDVAKGRRLRRLEKEADALVRAKRKEKHHRGA